MLLQPAYLSVINTFTLLRLLPMSDRDTDVEILVLWHQIAILERQLGKARPRFSSVAKALKRPDPADGRAANVQVRRRWDT